MANDGGQGELGDEAEQFGRTVFLEVGGAVHGGARIHKKGMRFTCPDTAL